jgi:hypothetical protein
LVFSALPSVLRTGGLNKLGGLLLPKLATNSATKMLCVALGGTVQKLWIDDLRTPPEGWQWAKTSAYAINFLTWSRMLNIRPEIISFDHDLGGDDTTRPVVLWCCEYDFWPTEAYVHSMNNVGREWLCGMIQRYAPEGTLK